MGGGCFFKGEFLRFVFAQEELKLYEFRFAKFDRKPTGLRLGALRGSPPQRG